MKNSRLAILRIDHSPWSIVDKPVYINLEIKEMKIKRDVLDKIIEHAKRDAPIEACGYLAGKDGIVNTHYELLNIDNSSEHFSFDPRDQFTALKGAREKGLQILAVYHSHPNSPARPSEEDKKLAYDSNLSYVIASLAGEKNEVKSFRIKESEVQEENLEVVE